MQSGSASLLQLESGPPTSKVSTERGPFDLSLTCSDSSSLRLPRSSQPHTDGLECAPWLPRLPLHCSCLGSVEWWPSSHCRLTGVRVTEGSAWFGNLQYRHSLSFSVDSLPAGVDRHHLLSVYLNSSYSSPELFKKTLGRPRGCSVPATKGFETRQGQPSPGDCSGAIWMFPTFHTNFRIAFKFFPAVSQTFVQTVSNW